VLSLSKRLRLRRAWVDMRDFFFSLIWAAGVDAVWGIGGKETITARVRVSSTKNDRRRLGEIAWLPQLSTTRDKAMPS
jgi:hypothetical protein